MGKITGFKEYSRSEQGLYREPIERIDDFDEIFVGNYESALLQKQGARCMDCGVPFCQSDYGCPIRNIIPEWNDLVYRNKWQEACENLHNTNNFPEFTGRVCPAPCESACVLGIIDKPVTIKNIELAIAEKGFENGWIKAKSIKNRTKYKVAIIGSGPAGLSCADELNKKGHNVTVYEREDRIGGLLMYGIPNMKLTKNIVDRRVNILREEGIEFKVNVDIGKSISIKQLQDNYDAILLSTGATKPKKMPFDWQNMGGVYYAMDYLTQTTKYILDKNYPVNIDATGKDVIVIGAGDTGADCVATAIRQGAKSVINFARSKKPSSFRTDKQPWPEIPFIFKLEYSHNEYKSKFNKECREYAIVTKKFETDSSGNITAVVTEKNEFENNKLIKTSEKRYPAQLVLIAIGYDSPEDYIIKNTNIELGNRKNYQTIKNSLQTDTKGVFAAGDCRLGQSLIVWAIEEGRNAAKEIDKYLNTR